MNCNKVFALISEFFSRILLKSLRFFNVPLTKYAAPVSAGAADNLYNEQDDQSVHYDGTKWIQPGDGGVSEIDLSAYKGRLVLFSAMS